MRLLARVFFFLRLTVLGLLLVLVAALAYVLKHEDGAALVLEQASLLTGGRVRAEAAQGPLLGPFTLTNFVYEDSKTAVRISRATLEWDAWALVLGRLRVTRLDAGTVQLVIKPRSEPARELRPALTRLPFALRLRESQIERFELLLPSQTLAFDDIRLSARWRRDDIRISELALRYAPVGALALEGELRLQPYAIQLLDVNLSLPAPLRLSGEMGYDGKSVQAEARWGQLQWPLQGDPLLLSRIGRLSVQGEWEAYRFELASELAARGQQGRFTANGQGGLRGITVQALELAALSGKASAQGALDWLPSLALSTRGDFQALNPQSLAADWPGKLSGRFAFKGGLHEVLSLQLELADSQLRGYPLALDAQAEWQTEQLRFKDLLLSSGSSRLQGAGQVLPSLDVRAEISSDDLAELWPGLAGRLQATVQARGDPQQPRVLAQARAQALRYADLAMAEAQVDADLHPRETGRFSVQIKDLAAAELRLPQLSFSGTGRAAQHELSLELDSPAGPLGLGLAGALGTREWRGQLTHGEGRPPRLPPWRLEAPAPLRISATQADLGQACWQSGGSRACFEAQRAGAAVQAAFSLRQFDLASLASFLPEGWRVAATVEGQGQVDYRPERTRAEVALRSSAGSVALGATPLLRFAPGELNITESDQGLRALLQLPLEQGELAADAQLRGQGTARQWGGQVRLALDDLTPLRLFSPELEALTGRLRGSFDLSGALRAPRLAGSLTLSDGAARLASPGLHLREVTATLSGTPEGEVRFNAALRSGDGRLEITGSGRQDAPGLALDLTARGQDLLASDTSQVRLWVSPDLRLQLAEGQFRLTGELAVPRADIAPRSFSQGLGPSGDQVLLKPDGTAVQRESTLPLSAQVRVRLGDAVRFDGFGLKTRLSGALEVLDAPGQPTSARGEVRLLDGTYQAYGQDLSIETGRLLWSGGAVNDPALELRAQRVPREDITVGVRVRGALDAPEFSLYSTPTMPQERQLSWLVLGRALDESVTGEAERDELTNAALSLGLSGGNYLAQGVRSGLRLDDIKIASKAGESPDQAKITFGKYLSSRLYVSYGIGLFQPGHAFRLLYDLGRGFKLSTESGVESGGDLLYTIER